MQKISFLSLIFSFFFLTFSPSAYSSIEMANAEDILKIDNYLGNTENIHPKVLYFEEGWNGYEFWMAYTPYPLGSTDAENPCLAVSHDGIDWITPEGLTNPLSPTPANGYNSDTHLVYDAEKDHMEIWWRPYDHQLADGLSRRISSDGIHWGPEETVVDYKQFSEGVMSPAVWIADGKYKLIYCNGSRLKYMESPYEASRFEWSEPVELPIAWGGLYAWHHDAILDEQGNLELVVCAFERGGNNNTADLYYVKMDPDLQKASVPELILKRGEGERDFDHRSIYRSSLVKVGTLYYLYYSAIDDGWHRYMTLSRGKTPQSLVGLHKDPDDDFKFMHSDLIINEVMAANVSYVIDDLNDCPDSWIEIHNPTSEAISLGGYGIGIEDNAGNAYSLPAEVTIGPDEHLLVYCDNKASGLHTNFKLSEGADKVYLFKGNSVIDNLIIDSPLPSVNISYGRLFDCSETRGYQVNPSPGRKNTGGIGSQLLGAPLFSEKGKLCGSDVKLELSLPADAPANTRIVYTLDGSEPTKDSWSYTQPLLIHSNCVVKAKLVNSNAISPLSSTESYIFHPRDLSMPVLSVVADDRFLFGETDGLFNSQKRVDGIEGTPLRRPANIEYFDINRPDLSLNRSVRIGLLDNASSSDEFNSLLLESDKRLGSEFLDYEFFDRQKPGRTDYRSLEAYNEADDLETVYFQDALIQRWMGDYADIDYKAWQPVILYVNGEYKGILNLREPSHSDFVDANYPETGELDIIANSETPLAGTLDNFNLFKDFYETEGHSLEEYESVMDVEEFCNLAVLNMFMADVNFPENNSVIWRDSAPESKWRWMASHFAVHPDYNLLQEDFNYLKWLENPEAYSDVGLDTPSEPSRLWKNLINNEEFRRLFVDRSLVYLGDFLKPGNFKSLGSKMSSVLEEEWEVYADKHLPSGYDLAANLNNLNDYIARRYGSVYEEISDYFKLGEPIPLVIDNGARGGKISIQDIKLSGDIFEGKYPAGRSFKLSTDKPFRMGAQWIVEITDNEGEVSKFGCSIEEFYFDMPEAASVRIYITEGFDPGADGLVLNTSEISLRPGETFKLSAVILPEDTDSAMLNWESLSPEIASVASDGLVTAIAEGTAIIRAVCGQYTAECQVTVTSDSSVDSIYDFGADKVSIFTTDGKQLVTDGTLEDLRRLPKGIYIIVSGNRRFKTLNP